MQTFDTSSIIYAWDNYPIDQFPGVWNWLSDRIAERLITMSEVAMFEVGHRSPEWLRGAGLETLAVTDAVLAEALRIKTLLGIEGDAYGSGVDENDLLIIATAKLAQLELVTNEAFQMTPNRQGRNWKIPAVCRMDSVDVEPIDFLRFLKRSEVIFR